MKLLIDMPDEIYEILKNNGVIVNGLRCGKTFLSEVFAAVANGTPLPKGHGRLIDADVLEQEIISGIKAGNYEEGCEQFPHINDMGDCVECVRYSNTIIEADRSVET